MRNPEIKFAKSKGVDLPLMYVYLAGRICGEHIDKCLGWRKKIVNHYRYYKHTPNLDKIGFKYEAYPIAFLCPLNSGEATTVDKKGLTSHIPPNLIYAKDLLSVQRADVIVANMEDFFEEDIAFLLDIQPTFESQFTDNIIIKDLNDKIKINYKKAFFTLVNKILNRRENIGTIMEVAIALYLQKPVILIVPEKRREIFERHPFTKRASVIVTSVEELLEKKWLNNLYKSIAGAIYGR